MTFPMGVIAGEFSPRGAKDSHGNTIHDPTAKIDDYRARLPEFVDGIYNYWAEARRALARGGPHQPFKRAPRARPNDPCECGSGKKFKKCRGQP